MNSAYRRLQISADVDCEPVGRRGHHRSPPNTPAVFSTP